MTSDAIVRLAPEALTDRGNAALTALADELVAIDKQQLLAINIDLTQAIALGLAAANRLPSVRAELARQLPLFDLRRIDHIKLYSLALRTAYARQKIARRKHGVLQPLVNRAKELRTILLSVARTLIARRVFEASRLRALGRATSAKDLAMQLGMLSALLQEALPLANTAINAAELDEALVVSEQILRAINPDKDEHPDYEQASELLQRTFTLFSWAYDDARRVITFLRWRERDVDRYVPSLYRKTKKRKAKVVESGQESPA